MADSKGFWDQFAEEVKTSHDKQVELNRRAASDPDNTVLTRVATGFADGLLSPAMWIKSLFGSGK